VLPLTLAFLQPATTDQCQHVSVSEEVNRVLIAGFWLRPCRLHLVPSVPSVPNREQVQVRVDDTIVGCATGDAAEHIDAFLLDETFDMCPLDSLYLMEL